MKQVALCFLFLLGACGGISAIDENQQITTEAKLPDIDPNSGQLCICRTLNYVGGGGILGLNANDEYIGDMPNGSHLCVNLTPDEYSITGTCTFCPRVGAETTIRKGQRKYMELYVGINGMNLHSTSKEVGLACIAGTM